MKPFPDACTLDSMKKICAWIILIFFLPAQLNAMTYKQEQDLSDKYISMLEQNNLLIHNPDITWTLQSTLDNLSAQIESPMYLFKIHLVRDYSINAFAIPAGHIFINLGTLLAARDMDEIASVLGHEMGHCQLRHIPKRMDTNKVISAGAVAGVILGTILSTQNPQAGGALIMSSIGGSQNIQLAYSRKHEYQADEFSRNILSASGYDPAAMTRFLIRLRTLSGAPDIPEYFMSHPYLKQRIASVQRQQDRASPEKRYWNLYAVTVGLMLDENRVMARCQKMPQTYQRLAKGLLLAKTSRYSRAITLLRGLDNPTARAYLGYALYKQGKTDEAYPLLKANSRSEFTARALSEILESRGMPDEAIRVLLPFKEYSPKTAYRLGVLYKETSKTAHSHLCFAEYFYQAHKSKASIWHIDEALKGEKTLTEEEIKKLNRMKKEINKKT